MLHLILSSFDSMPVPAPPVGYRIQSYQPGDHRHWSHIMAQSHRGPDDYIFEALIRRQPAFQGCGPVGSCMGRTDVYLPNRRRRR